MGLKVDMSEVRNLKKSISNSLDSVNEKVNSLSSSMSNLVNAEGFEGEAATSVKTYTNTFHIKTIDKIEKINERFKSDMSKSIEKFQSEVDNNESAILVEDQIKEYKTDIEDAIKEVYRSASKANEAIAKVSELTTATEIKKDNLFNKMGEFNKHIDKTIEKLTSFDSNNSIDGDRTDNLITELSGLSSYVKGLSPNRARIKSTSSKIENAIIRHKTSEKLIKWQKLMESTSDKLYSVPGLSKKNYDLILTAGREYFALKAIGGGSARKGFSKYMNIRDMDKLINNLDKKTLSKMATIFNTDRGNIKIKNVIKNAGEFVKSNPFEKGNLVNWMTKVQEYDSKSAELLKQIVKDKNFQYQFGDAKKFFDEAEVKKAAKTEFKNTFVKQSFRETILKKENFQSATAFQKNIKKYWNDDIKQGVKEFGKGFKNKNILGKSGMLLNGGGKIFKPIAFVSAFTDNLNKDSKQEQLVSLGVDLSIASGSIAAGTAIGTAIPIPVVGPILGAIAGGFVGMAADFKIGDKAIKDHVKDGINSGLNKTKDAFSNGWGQVASGFKSVFN
ncbi:T7SS effector LXG polymorphic toxin [Staphylococcus sp. SQ8-PEA]|uniref:T7SS effector LXG polymorphic toxin n=1 Tax=Staphylococcus marylandisciuri TaxID=2981529 RepID=A0ABT2QNW6_9STAP|nr:T7SS effector LXG polymorphic toxin [Staphylococcus marylandisciuri]MCU5745669.1 T7SS effector LXG polymorphic toxin [Staphylococcus marylandisciuri]